MISTGSSDLRDDRSEYPGCIPVLLKLVCIVRKTTDNMKNGIDAL
jgi:hypothetical protein